MTRIMAIPFAAMRALPIAPTLAVIFALLLTAMLTGCATHPPLEQLPRFPLTDARSTLAAVAAEFHAVHDVSAQGEVALSEPNGDHVRLDAVLALLPPDAARMQAFKFGEVVFDLTIKPGGVWLLGGDGGGGRAAKIRVSAAQLARSMAMLDGKLFDEPDLRLHDEGDRVIVERDLPDGPTVRCTIDRATRTVRRYDVLDDRKQVRFSLTQSDFASHGGIPWPNRIDALSDRGHVTITLRDVQINQGLPAGAFTPPRRAVKLP